MVAVLLLAIGATAVVFYLTNPGSIALRQGEQTAAAFALGKQALIGYAAGHATRPGALPCPDTNNDGDGESPSPQCPAYLGRLPWRTLGLPDIRDGNGERLWYALSPDYRNLNPPTGPVLNPEVSGQLTADSAPGIVALLISPGPALAAQNRGGAAINTASNFLEGGNELGGTTRVFASGNSTSANDRLMTITNGQLMSVVEQRVAKEIRANLLQYYTAHSHYPYAAELTGKSCSPGLYQGRLPVTSPCNAAPGVTLPDITLPSWFIPNEWYRTLLYAVAPRCTPKIDSTISGGTFLWPTNLGPCTYIPFIKLWICSLPITTTYSVDSSALGCNNTSDGNPAGSLLTVDSSGNIHALLLSAGAGFVGQARPCSTLSNCLEDSENADNDYIFVQPQKSPINNDGLTVAAP